MAEPIDIAALREATQPGEGFRPNRIPAVKPHKTFAFRAVGDLKLTAPEFVVDGLIETDTLGLLFGEPGCGKSFIAVDLGLSVATGAPFHGRPVRQGPVFLIAGEGHAGLVRRFRAWSMDRGIPLDGVPMFKSERAAQFLDRKSATAVADAVNELATDFGLPALIIIDTVARNFGPGDENSTKDMGEFIAAIDDMKAKFPKCAVLLVHHSGHAEKERARGAIALKGALDCEFMVRKSETRIIMRCTKMKDADEPAPLSFALQNVKLDEVTESATLLEIDTTQSETRLSPGQKLAMETFVIAAAQNGQFGTDGFQGLHVDLWRPEFYRKHTGDNNSAKRQAFHRVRADLVSAGLLRVDDDLYRATDPAVILAISMERDRRDKA